MKVVITNTTTVVFEVECCDALGYKSFFEFNNLPCAREFVKDLENMGYKAHVNLVANS